MTLEQAVNNADSRYVPLNAGGAIASGVIIGTGFVLTCFHSLRVDNGIKVGDVEAEIIGVDPAHDLALLEVPTIEVEAITLGSVFKGESVFSIGNPHGLSGALLFGRVVFLDDKKILHDMHGAPGISGSGLWDCAGELVGINHSVIGQKHIGNWLTASVPAFHLQKILRSVFRIAQPTDEEIAKYGVVNEETPNG